MAVTLPTVSPPSPLVAVLAVILAATTSAAAQERETTPATPATPVAPVAPSPSAEDSVDLHERARDAQRRFERIRVRHLPRVWSPPAGPCDIRVGRMCQWHDPDGDWTPHPPVPEIEDERRELLAVLRDVGTRLPGDAWILGQRIHYLAEVGRWEEARRAAEGCPREAVGWWCAALLGFVLHGSGAYLQAERAFDEALAGAEEEVGEEVREDLAEWRHPTEILDREARDLLDDAPGDGRAAFYRRFWALADPLYLVPGNDRRTAHLARRVVARIRRDARTPFGGRFGDDMAEVLVRYGWEVGWERSRGRPGSLSDDGSVLGQQHPRAQRFVPTGEALRDLSAVEPGPWIGEERAPPATYAPLYAPDLGGLDAQVAVFRTGDSLVVVATYRLPPEEEEASPDPDEEGGTFLFPPPERPEWERAGGGLFLVRWGEAGPREVLEARRAGGTEGVLSLRAPAGTYMVSLEHLDGEGKRAGRHRMALSEAVYPPGVPVLSDLLLLEPRGELPETLEEAIPRARPGARVVAGERIRVAFAVHGLRGREAVTLQMTLEPADVGLFRRAGEWIGVLDPERPVSLDWEEVTEVGPPPYFRAVELALPEVEPGAYVLRLAVALRGRTTMVTSRRLQVVP